MENPTVGDYVEIQLVIGTEILETRPGWIASLQPKGGFVVEIIHTHRALIIFEASAKTAGGFFQVSVHNPANNRVHRKQEDLSNAYPNGVPEWVTAQAGKH